MWEVYAYVGTYTYVGVCRGELMHVGVYAYVGTYAVVYVWGYMHVLGSTEARGIESL